jgi:hypothetical protein
MPVKLQTIHGLHPYGVLRTIRFVPDEPVTVMTVKTLMQSILRVFSTDSLFPDHYSGDNRYPLPP